MVWRVFYSVLAVPFGVFTLNQFRKRHGALLTEAWTAVGDMREGIAETEEFTMPEKAAMSG